MKQQHKGLAAGSLGETARKLRHLRFSIGSDLTLKSVVTFEFWMELFLLLVALWIRIYVHYIGMPCLGLPSMLQPSPFFLLFNARCYSEWCCDT